MSSLENLVNISAQDSQDFYHQFFKALDTFRSNIPQYIKPNTAIVWNGNPIGGDQAFMAMYEKMPITKHDVTDFNVHPLVKNNNQNMDMILDTSGRVKYGTDRRDQLGFSAIFILTKDASISAYPVIKSFTYRIVHKPAESNLQT